MEQLIEKYNFTQATKDVEDEFTNQLNSLKIDRGAISLKDFEGVCRAYKTRVCVRGFPKRMSHGYWMAERCLKRMLDVAESGRSQIPKEKGQSLMLDVYLALMKSGPGSSHCELMEEISKHREMQTYLQNLHGKELTSWAAAFKEICYTQEPDSDVADVARTVKGCLPHQIEIVVGKDTTRLKEPANWEVFLDLYIFCLTSIPQQPHEDYSKTLVSCMDRICRPYDKTFYSDFPKADVIRSHLKLFIKLVSEKDFPHTESIMTPSKNFEKKIIGVVKSKFVTDVWQDLLELLRTVCCHGNSSQLEDVISPLRDIVEDMDEKVLKANPSLFESWAPIAADILQKMVGNPEIMRVLSWHCKKMEKAIQPGKAGYDKLWMTILKGLLKWPYEKTTGTAKHLLTSTKLKKIWKWKEHIDDAGVIIKVIASLPFPYSTDSDDERAVRDVVSNCADILQELVKQLEKVKKSDDVQPALADLALTYLEQRNPVTTDLAYKGADLLDLKSHRDVIEGLLSRFTPLFLDEDYPWDTGVLPPTGNTFLLACINAHETSKDMSEAVHKQMIELLVYALDEKHEITDLSSGEANVYTWVLNVCLPVYLVKHRGEDTIHIIEPLLGPVFKFMTNNKEEDQILENIATILQVLTMTEPQILSPYGDMIMELYMEKRNAHFLSLAQNCYRHMKDSAMIEQNFSQLMEVFVEERDSYGIQILFLKDVADTHPELFDEDIMESIMTNHFTNPQSSLHTLCVLESLAASRPELVKPYYPDKILDNPSIPTPMAHTVVKISVGMVEKYEEYKDVVLKYLIKTFESSSDPIQVVASVTGLRGLCALFGVDMVKPYKAVVEKKKNEGMDTTIQDSASQLLDVLEGRSLAKVAQDVEENKEETKNLTVAVAGTKVVMKKVQRTVNQQDKDIKENKAGLVVVNQRVDVVEEDLEETKGKVEEIDMKTMSNAPKWSRDVTKLMNVESDHDWRLLASRLGYSPDDIRGWATQSDPCMALLSEWYATHKTVEATHGVLVALQEMNRLDAAVIVENAMKAAEGVVADEPVDYPEPPEIFLSYQWGHQNEVKLIQRHLEMAGYKCWMDVGQMGGGDKLFEKIDSGIRAAKVIICCVTEKYAKSPNCIREVNLSVNLGKPIIPLLLEKMSWPPKGSMGPIFSEYLFIRFFQRKGEETGDDRIWPVPKFQELLMQLNYLKIMPDEDLVTEEYKNWWIPVVEEIIIQKKDGKPTETARTGNSPTPEVSSSPDVFISYQWGKQKEISALYQRLTSLGFTCWMDIHQMGGGDSLYDKIDRGVRGCKVMLSSITQKYALSANCRREVSLADAVKKPIIPLLMEKCDWPPSGPMSMVFTQLLFINFSKDESVQLRWDGPKFDELLQKLHVHVPIASNEANQNEDSTTRKAAPDPKDERAGEKPVKEEQPKAKVSSVAAVASGAPPTDRAKGKDVADTPRKDQKTSRGVNDTSPGPGTDGSLPSGAQQQKKSSACDIL